MKLSIVLAGVGGQGLVTAGVIIGQAASLYENKQATLTSAYGAEARGTFTKSDIILSDSAINYPNVAVPDVLLCLAQVAYERYLGTLTDDTKVFYDNDMVTPATGAKGCYFGYPFRKMSIEMGSESAAISIALGAMIRHTDMLQRSSVIHAIGDQFAGKQKLIDINVAALDSGYAL